MQGKELIARCPFPEHNDSTPSFSMAISGDRIGFWQCFGCGSKGNTIHLVQRVLGVEREQAEKRIAQWFGFPDSLMFPSTDELSKLLDKKAPEDEEEDIIRIPLPKTDDGKYEIVRYLMTKRNYTEKQALDIINFYNIKWVESGYYGGRLIIPIYDSLGSLITFEARSMGKVEPKTLYPKGSPMARVLFNNHNLQGGQVWVTEGVWDAVRLWTFGEPAVSTFGAHLSNHQARILISKYSDVFLLFDGDDAGRKAKEQAAELLKPYINIYEVDLWFGSPSNLNKEEFRELMRQLNIMTRRIK